MAFTDTTVPYEILIRFGEDAAPRGAHVQWRRIIDIDGERLKDEVLPAEPLALEGFPTSAIMTQATQAALVRINELEAQLAQASADLDAAVGRAEQAEAQLQQLGVAGGSPAAE